MNWHCYPEWGEDYYEAQFILLVWGVTGVPTSAQTPKQGLIKARYVESKVSKDAGTAPVLVEEGTYLIDPEGRYRIERTRGGSRTAEIVDLRGNRRSALDLDRKVAVIGSMSEVLPGNFSLPGGPLVDESAGSPQRQRGETLATKVVAGGLALQGVRFTLKGAVGVTLTMENWYYRFSDRTMAPVMLELRFEDARSITVREVTDVAELPMDEGMFAVPLTFTVVRKPAPPVRRYRPIDRGHRFTTTLTAPPAAASVPSRSPATRLPRLLPRPLLPEVDDRQPGVAP
jgi:hypothetical protein